MLDRCVIVYKIILTHMKRTSPDRKQAAKTEALRQEGALHPHPERVRDDAFRRQEFFDARDCVQVRYEMLRRHRVEQAAVTDLAAAFGVSRQTFYTTAAAFAERGVASLLPSQRGPRGAHKCTDEMLDFVERWREAAPQGSAEELVRAVRERFGVSVHPRSLDRALARRKKNDDDAPEPVRWDRLRTIDWAQAYENLRREAVGGGPRGPALELFVARGMLAWLQALTVWGPAARPARVAPQETVKLPAAGNTDWTLLLADMVLGCWERQTACRHPAE